MALTRNKMASQHNFAMVPRADIPRSRYLLQQSRKTTFNGGDLVPIYCEEMLPGDNFDGTCSIFARLATPIVPVMDNAELETFFFFVPNRLVWDNWEEFISGGDFTVPTITTPANGFSIGSPYDYFGVPASAAIAPITPFEISALPLRAYYLIYQEWFRDQNLTPNFAIQTDDGPDAPSDYTILKRNKKHDYFTSALPWPQKGDAVELPLGTTADVLPIAGTTAADAPTFQGLGTTGSGPLMTGSAAGNPPINQLNGTNNVNNAVLLWDDPKLYADLSTATAATVNELRQAFQIQRLLERDARGGTRYIEQIQSHFGVRPPDFRLQRPEYIGGGKTMVNTHPVAQTSGTGVTDQDTPQGNLSAFMTAQGGGHSFKYAAQEHGYIIGIANLRTDITYQQGLRRHWSRQTRYDYYFPVFAHLGEQAILEKEILAGTPTQDDTFAFQERWAEYRYTPNEITGLFRSTAVAPIDIWHYSVDLDYPIAFNQAFMTDSSEDALARSMAVGTSAEGQQCIMDMLFRVNATRPMPTYSVPGLIDHF